MDFFLCIKMSNYLITVRAEIAYFRILTAPLEKRFLSPKAWEVLFESLFLYRLKLSFLNIAKGGQFGKVKEKKKKKETYFYWCSPEV